MCVSWHQSPFIYLFRDQCCLIIWWRKHEMSQANVDGDLLSWVEALHVIFYLYAFRLINPYRVCRCSPYNGILSYIIELHPIRGITTSQWRTSDKSNVGTIYKRSFIFQTSNLDDENLEALATIVKVLACASSYV